MSLPTIEIERVTKKYRLGKVGATTLREDIGRLWRRVRGAEQPPEAGEFWALRDVTFKVAPGEVVGLIGRNGAGKSTLLKILSRITEPTTGRAMLRGRVASLLEVGTGFHPDLTGRENVFLNGAILGMKEKEIAAHFDEIVAFAEVEKFIDTPVKHYSSGMRVRLAFAVAAHLDAEILIVDEVLAVGDMSFQQRCLQRMNELAHRRARTILLVSHQLEMVRRLADRCLLLDGGRVVFDGPTVEAISRHTQETTLRMDRGIEPTSPDEAGSIIRVRLQDERGVDVAQALPVGASWRVVVDLELRRPMSDAVVALAWRTGEGIWVRTGWSRPRSLPAGHAQIVFSSGTWRLAPGNYYAAVGLSASSRSMHYVEDVAALAVSRMAIDDVAVRLEGVGLILDPWESQWS